MTSRINLPLRASIYYWKCDRPAAFHGTSGRHEHARFAQEIKSLIEEHFSAPAEVQPGTGQGNHITFTATCKGLPLFVRIDDSPEQDDYLAVESRIQETVRALGIATPRVHAVDATRRRVDFAWQILERIGLPDLNQHYKKHVLDLTAISRAIGSAIAHWQSFQPKGFGPFQPSGDDLRGIHARYSDYFFQNFERHLAYLTQHDFLTPSEATDIQHEVLAHQSLLQLKQGCLVHKDLAFWNILGTPDEVAAFIDWDDAISGDPMDDFSLLACFHDSRVLQPAVAAYQTHRPLPSDYQRRFWLHLLRNMLVKAVIRVGAGYFNRNSSFFLVNDGIDLKTFTHKRLHQALDGLRQNASLDTLQ